MDTAGNYIASVDTQSLAADASEPVIVMPTDFYTIGVAIDEVGDFEPILLRTFLEEASASIGYIERAVVERAFDRLRVFAHQLKGACLCIGAPYVSELASALERHGAEQRRDDIEKNWCALSEEFRRLESYLKARLTRAAVRPRPRDAAQGPRG